MARADMARCDAGQSTVGYPTTLRKAHRPMVNCTAQTYVRSCQVAEYGMSRCVLMQERELGWYGKQPGEVASAKVRPTAAAWHDHIPRKAASSARFSVMLLYSSQSPPLTRHPATDTQTAIYTSMSRASPSVDSAWPRAGLASTTRPTGTRSHFDVLDAEAFRLYNRGIAAYMGTDAACFDRLRGLQIRAHDYRCRVELWHPNTRYCFRPSELFELAHLIDEHLIHMDSTSLPISWSHLESARNSTTHFFNASTAAFVTSEPSPIISHCIPPLPSSWHLDPVAGLASAPARIDKY